MSFPRQSHKFYNSSSISIQRDRGQPSPTNQLHLTRVDNLPTDLFDMSYSVSFPSNSFQSCPTGEWSEWSAHSTRYSREYHPPTQRITARLPQFPQNAIFRLNNLLRTSAGYRIPTLFLESQVDSSWFPFIELLTTGLP